MRARTLLFLAVCSFALVACGRPDGPPVSGDQPSALGDAVDLKMRSYMAEHGIPGATVAVTKGGRLVFWKAYGWADVDAKIPMEPWHRTRIGSVSKVLTAIGVLQLVDAGELRLDQPVYSSRISITWPSTGGDPLLVFQPDGALADVGMYLKALAEAPSNLTPDANAPEYLTGATYEENVETLMEWARQIQIQHVLSHTAGYLENGSAPKARTYWGLGDSDPLTYAQIHAAMLAGTNGLPLLFEAGSDWDYSNHGFGVLGQIIEDTSGMPYADYMQEHVFGPVGRFDVVSADVVTDRDATSYKEDGTPVPLSQLTEPVAGLATGGWAASAGDLARILCAVDEKSDHQRLLSPELAKAMTIPRFPAVSSNSVLGWDGRSDLELYVAKNGRIPKRGGAARIVKYLPGYPLSMVSTEINVAVAFNIAKTPGRDLVNEIAKLIEDTPVAPSFDLFPPQYRCIASPPLTIPEEEPL